MGLGEFSRSVSIAVPLVNEFAILIEVNYACGAHFVRRREIDVIGALVRMTLEDIDIAIRSEIEHHRLPDEPLSLRFIPIAPFSPHSEGHEELSLGTYFLDCGAIRVADPDVVLCVDFHAVRLVLV